MKIKFLIIPIIALGCILSGIVQLKYTSGTSGWIGTYYASPFVYKSPSPVTSMEYYYSIGGLVANVVVWSILLFLIDWGIRCISALDKFRLLYQFLIIALVVLSIVFIIRDSFLVGSEFGEYGNNWFWNIDKIAEEWGSHYQKEFYFFGFKLF